MKVNTQFKSLVFAIAALFSFSAFVPGVFSQQTRPRYSNQQGGGRSWTIPADTVISMRMDSNLSSRTARVGDKFSSTVAIPVYIDGVTVIPAGSIVEGRVTQVTPAKRMSKSGTIAIDFDELIFPGGARIQLDGNLTSDDPSIREDIDDESRVSGRNEKRPAVFIGGGGAIGAVLGGISGGGKGAVIGGVLGAGAGVAGVLFSKGEEAQVPAGTPFAINLTQPVMVMESQLPDRRSQDYDNNNGANDSSYPSRNSDPRDVSRRDPRDSTSRDPYPSRDSRDPNPSRDSSAPSRDSEYPTEPEPSSDSGPADSIPDAEPSETVEETLPLSSPEMLRRAQVELKNQGYYEGQADGAMSPRTANALKTYQQEHNLPATGELDPRTAASLGITGGSKTGGAAQPRPAGQRAPSAAPGVVMSTPPAARPTPVRSSGDSGAGASLQRQAEELLAEYQRNVGMRLTGTGIELDGRGQYGESEIELLFALDSFANAAQLYSRLVSSSLDQSGLRAATLSLARQARATDRVMTTTSSRTADVVSRRWDSIRQDVLRLMQRYNINSSDIED